MSNIRLATVRLDGCSGCHMSFLDIDDRLFELVTQAEIVYSPLVDTKQFPKQVDIALVEGAVSTAEDMEKIHEIRKKTKILVAFGDCAVTANVSAMRNPFGKSGMLDNVYRKREGENSQIPSQDIPELLEQALPIHHVVNVDLFVPGCPPSANTIFYALTELIAGRMPDLTSLSRFGA